MSTGLNFAEGSEHRMFVRRSANVSRKKVAGMNATANDLEGLVKRYVQGSVEGQVSLWTRLKGNLEGLQKFVHLPI